jgi:hypothetical protein
LLISIKDEITKINATMHTEDHKIPKIGGIEIDKGKIEPNQIRIIPINKITFNENLLFSGHFIRVSCISISLHH